MWIALSAIFGAGWPRWIPDAARACAARVDRRSMPGDWRTGASPRQTMAGGDVGGRATDGVDSPVAVGGRIAQGQWLFNRGRAGFACVNKPGWLWPLRMARHVCERATRGGERRNTAAYDKDISLGVCRAILGVSVNDAGSIFWCARARRLVYSAAQWARRAVSSLAQWQRPRMWIYVAAPHRAIKPSWGCDAQAELMRIPAFPPHKCPRLRVIPKKVEG